MERKIIEKIQTHNENFKNSIKIWVEENNSMDFDCKSDLLKFIYDFDGITLTKEDFVKRKRTKSSVPTYLRCNAKRACGEQCTRKKKEDSIFCGTHDKNRPHGVISDINTEQTMNKNYVWIQEINGIHYYIDDFSNIYKTEDILENKPNPKIIAKYKIEDNTYKFISV